MQQWNVWMDCLGLATIRFSMGQFFLRSHSLHPFKAIRLHYKFCFQHSFIFSNQNWVLSRKKSFENHKGIHTVHLNDNGTFSVILRSIPFINAKMFSAFYIWPARSSSSRITCYRIQHTKVVCFWHVSVRLYVCMCVCMLFSLWWFFPLLFYLVYGKEQNIDFILMCDDVCETMIFPVKTLSKPTTFHIEYSAFLLFYNICT